jgi:imidazolonepropionase-like amidohydrolase
VLAALVMIGSAGASESEEKAVWAIQASKVIARADMDDTLVFNPGVVLIEGNQVKAVGQMGKVELPEGCEVVDVGKRWIVPGFIDLHCHVGGPGYNDMVYLNNPDLQSSANISPENNRLKNALAGGVTSVLYIPGSGTNMGGLGVFLKTAGSTLEEMLIEDPGSLKIAQAGNPEWYFGGVRRSMMNWNLRQTLDRAKKYHEACLAHENGEASEPPRRNADLDRMRGLFRLEFPISLHTQWYQVALQSITMLRRDLGVNIFIDHGTFEAWRLGEVAERFGVPVINGPRQLHFERRDRQIQGNCWGWWKEGVRELGVNTDSGVIPQHELPYQAAMAVHFGWDDPLLALRGITMVPARTMSIAERLGSLEPGKDADLGVWSGDPIDPSSQCSMTIVNGKVAYDAARDGQRF